MTRRMLSSFISAVIGWIAFVLIFGSHFLLTLGRSSLAALPAAAGMAAVVIFFVWLLLLLPLYVLVPRQSILWLHGVCISGGALAGAVIFAALFCWMFHVYPKPLSRRIMEVVHVPFFYVGPLVGAITCAAGWTLNRRQAGH